MVVFFYNWRNKKSQGSSSRDQLSHSFRWISHKSSENCGPKSAQTLLQPSEIIEDKLWWSIYQHRFFWVQTSIYVHENAIAVIEIGVLFSPQTRILSILSSFLNIQQIWEHLSILSHWEKLFQLNLISQWLFLSSLIMDTSWLCICWDRCTSVSFKILVLDFRLF